MIYEKSTSDVQLTNARSIGILSSILNTAQPKISPPGAGKLDEPLRKPSALATPMLKTLGCVTTSKSSDDMTSGSESPSSASAVKLGPSNGKTEFSLKTGLRCSTVFFLLSMYGSVLSYYLIILFTPYSIPVGQQ